MLTTFTKKLSMVAQVSYDISDISVGQYPLQVNTSTVNMTENLFLKLLHKGAVT